MKNTERSIIQRIYSETASLLNIGENTASFCESVLPSLSEQFKVIDDIAFYNQAKVLSAMKKNRLSDSHFAVCTGYGYNDIGRDTLESIYTDVLHTEAALVRPQLISGTHAISTALFANLKSGDELLLATGMPYDTMQGVIGIRPTKKSLSESGVIYKIAELTDDGKADLSKIESLITPKTKMVALQRSKGYNWRRSFTVSELAEIIRLVKSIRSDIICFVDNCYGEFVELDEPSDYGADLIAGSLIKNPGGGLSPVGGYIAGVEEYVENAAYHLTAPGLGREVGPSLGVTQPMIQGLFLAPAVVSASVKGAVFAAAIFEKLGYKTLPHSTELRTDIVQAIRLNTPQALIAFCQGIQKGSPVDSHAMPEPSEMPGYDNQIIMAAGAFTQGSSIELSADAPLREPYTVFLQGGLTWQHAKAGIMTAINELVIRRIIEI